MIAVFAALALASQPAPPRVVQTYPAAGSVVPAGPLTLTATFDQPMQQGWSFVMSDTASYPDCAKVPSQSSDRKTFTLTCAVQAGRTYWIGFNSDSHQKFATPAGVPAAPSGLGFSAK